MAAILWRALPLRRGAATAAASAAASSATAPAPTTAAAVAAAAAASTPVAVPKAPLRPAPAPRNGMTHTKLLETIGRDCQKYAEQLKDWDTLFAADTLALKKLGVKPQQRKWILGWTEKYRQGVEPYLIAAKVKPKKTKAAGGGGKSSSGSAKPAAAAKAPAAAPAAGKKPAGK